MLKEALSSLKVAVESGRTDIVRSLISACERREVSSEKDEILEHLLNKAVAEEGTLLHIATKLNDSDTVRTLLSAGADPCINNAQGKTPIDLATSASVVAVYSEELLQATAASNVGRVCQLLASGVNINLVDSLESLNTPLHWAVSYGNKNMVQCLLDRGAKVNALNAFGASPLHDAVNRGDVSIVEELLSYGADFTTRANKGKFSGKSPLDLAVGKSEIYDIIVKGPSFPVIEELIEFHEKSENDNSVLLQKKDSISLENGEVTEKPLIENHNGSSDLNVGNHKLHLDRMTEMLTQNHITTPPVPLVIDSRLHYLWPQPHKIQHLQGEDFIPSDDLHVYIIPGPDNVTIHQINNVWGVLEPTFSSLEYCVKLNGVYSNIINKQETFIICHVNRRIFSHAESYRMILNDQQIKLLCSDLSGLYYGLCTLIQLLRLCSDAKGLPQLQINDWPMLRYRGFLVDLSHGRVPVLKALFDLIDVLSRLKINQVYLYIEFNVKDNSKWQCQYNQSEILMLDKFCEDRFISLIPAVDFSLDVTLQDSSTLFEKVQEFLAYFTSPCIHFGSRINSLLLCASTGRLQFQNLWKFLPMSHHLTIQLCSKGLHNFPKSLSAIPPNFILMDYGFQADHNFSLSCKPLVENGLCVCVCPGTAAWTSISGCPEAALRNIYSAAQFAFSDGAIGLVVIDWSGVGHTSPLPCRLPGLVAAAGLSWNVSSHWDYLHSTLADLLNRHVIMDDKGIIGQVIIDLGRLETYLLRTSKRQDAYDIHDLPPAVISILYQLLVQPDSVCLENLGVEIFHKTARRIRRSQCWLSTAASQSNLTVCIIPELQLTIDLLLLASRIGRALVTVGRNPSNLTGLAVVNLGLSNLSSTTKTDVANRILEILEDYRKVWLKRNQSLGLDSSLEFLNGVLKQLIPEVSRISDSKVIES